MKSLCRAKRTRTHGNCHFYFHYEPSKPPKLTEPELCRFCQCDFRPHLDIFSSAVANRAYLERVSNSVERWSRSAFSIGLGTRRSGDGG